MFSTNSEVTFLDQANNSQVDPRNASRNSTEDYKQINNSHYQENATLTIHKDWQMIVSSKLDVGTSSKTPNDNSGPPSDRNVVHKETDDRRTSNVSSIRCCGVEHRSAISLSSSPVWGFWTHTTPSIHIHDEQLTIRNRTMPCQWWLVQEIPFSTLEFVILLHTKHIYWLSKLVAENFPSTKGIT